MLPDRWAPRRAQSTRHTDRNLCHLLGVWAGASPREAGPAEGAASLLDDTPQGAVARLPPRHWDHKTLLSPPQGGAVGGAVHSAFGHLPGPDCGEPAASRFGGRWA